MIMITEQIESVPEKRGMVEGKVVDVSMDTDGPFLTVSTIMGNLIRARITNLAEMFEDPLMLAGMKVELDGKLVMKGKESMMTEVSMFKLKEDDVD